MVYLHNEELTVEINEVGAELFSVKTKEGKECIWNGDPQFWKGHAPNLFPLTGRLRDNKYIFEGKEYTLLSHGFAKNMEFEVNKKSDSCAEFTIHETEETLEKFPFKFTFKIIFTLEGRSVNVTYSVDNDNEKMMYFCVGGHEGYMCEGGIENYYIEFDKNVTLDTYTIAGPIITRETTRILENSNILPLKNEYFVPDALVFRDIDFDGLTIKKNDGTFNVRVDFKNHPHLLMWMVPGAPYICIEPWYGFPDFTDSNYIIEEKVGIQKLEAGKNFTCTHSMTF